MTLPESRPLPSNIQRDMRTVAAMVRIYCAGKHGGRGGRLCEACANLLGYADDRLARCPFAEEKTTCRDCPIHCYRPAERTEMKDVMRYAGPRMLWRHPVLAIRHLWMEREGGAALAAAEKTVSAEGLIPRMAALKDCPTEWRP